METWGLEPSELRSDVSDVLLEKELLCFSAIHSHEPFLIALVSLTFVSLCAQLFLKANLTPSVLKLASVCLHESRGGVSQVFRED